MKREREAQARHGNGRNRAKDRDYAADGGSRALCANVAASYNSLPSYTRC